MEIPAPRRLRLVVAVLSLMRRQGPVRLGRTAFVISVLSKASVDLTDARIEHGVSPRLFVINVLGVTDVKLPANSPISTIRLPLGLTRVSRGTALAPSPTA